MNQEDFLGFLGILPSCLLPKPCLIWACPEKPSDYRISSLHGTLSIVLFSAPPVRPRVFLLIAEQTHAVSAIPEREQVSKWWRICSLLHNTHAAWRNNRRWFLSVLSTSAICCIHMKVNFKVFKTNGWSLLIIYCVFLSSKTHFSENFLLLKKLLSAVDKNITTVRGYDDILDMSICWTDKSVPAGSVTAKIWN